MKRKKALCFEFKVMNHIIFRTIQRRLTEAGFDEVTVMHGHIMGYLYANSDHDIYARDIAKTFEIGKSSVTNILQLMEEKGYLTLEPDERDGRLKKICLTEKGKETQRQTMALIDKMHEDLEEGITEEEKQTFFLVAEKMKKNAAKPLNQ